MAATSKVLLLLFLFAAVAVQAYEPEEEVRLMKIFLL